MKICILGLGYIGLPTACLFANASYEIIGVEVNQETIGKSNQGKLPFEEKGLEEIFEKSLPNMRFKTGPEAADIFLIAVPTPLDGTIDFSSEITIPPNFTAERAENAERLEKPSGIWNTLKLCALCDLRIDKSLVFSIVPCEYTQTRTRRWWALHCHRSVVLDRKYR